MSADELNVDSMLQAFTIPVTVSFTVGNGEPHDVAQVHLAATVGPNGGICTNARELLPEALRRVADRLTEEIEQMEAG